MKYTVNELRKMLKKFKSHHHNQKDLVLLDPNIINQETRIILKINQSSKL